MQRPRAVRAHEIFAQEDIVVDMTTADATGGSTSLMRGQGNMAIRGSRCTGRKGLQLLSFYNIKVSDLGPHNVQQIALFVALCERYLGCPPYFPLWVSIFNGRATRASKSDRLLIPNGGITFQVKSGENFIDMALPKVKSGPARCSRSGASFGSTPWSTILQAEFTSPSTRRSRVRLGAST
ncbi:hypothetical protein QYE76_020714 [Lolium multiflorum]|uniref:Transposase (putative) gypsy type domain-containing protein n=1 Tax=Lolium multiflorum TaxID=4521 RepID=A0AAD8VPH7_LOLMU|nr:hypothetical protein QYE76_020714 [Lolium multiflorum]